MATITHKLTLSTTDHNLVGDIKVRQADEQTQNFETTILENGVVKSFVGLRPFFCLMAREITGQGVSEEPVTVYDGTKGTLKYTLSANAMQMVGRNEAYFSFRKELSNGEWAEQFSTRSFFYTVEKSIYTQPFKDSNYWFTFNELYQKFLNYQENGKTSWEEFVEQNKEIIENIDPGGKVLTELIAARNGKPNLKTRVDDLENETNAQLAQTAADLNIRAINLLYPPFPLEPCKGDGVEDDSDRINAIINSMSSGGTIEVPVGYTFLIGSTIRPKSDITITGKGVFLGSDNFNGNLILLSNVENVVIDSITLQHQKENIAETDGKTAIRMDQVYNSRIENCKILDCGGEGLYIRNTYNTYIKNNTIKNIDRNGMAITQNINNVTIESNTMLELNYHGINAENANETTVVSHLTIKDNYLEGSTYGILLTTTFSSDFIKYKNCTISNNTCVGFSEGITVRACDDVRIESNILRNVSRGIFVGFQGQKFKNVTVLNNAVMCKEGSGDTIVVIDGDSCKIVGNSLLNSNNKAVNLSGSTNSIIKDNNIRNVKSHGIQSTGDNDNVKIIDNTIINAAEVGIRVSVTSAGYNLNGMIKGNTVIDSREPKLTQYGIRFYGDPNRMYVTQNDVSRVGITPIILGTGTGIVNSQNNFNS